MGLLIGHRLQVCPHFGRNSRGYKRIPRLTDCAQVEQVHVLHISTQAGRKELLLQKKYCSFVLLLDCCFCFLYLFLLWQFHVIVSVQ